MIPRILHQTWKTAEIPDRWRRARESWLEAHPGWEYRFWTDEDLDQLVRERAPDFYPFWRRYPNQIQRVDAARYLILYEHGGVYADLDMICLRPLDRLLEHELVLPKTRPLGLSNQLMAARPGHPFMAKALRELPDAYRRWQRPWLPRHFRVLLTTGPLFLTGRYRENGARGDPKVRILSLDEHGHGDPDRSFVEHVRGRTWAEWDTHLLSLLHENWHWVAGLTATAVLAADALLP